MINAWRRTALSLLGLALLVGCADDPGDDDASARASNTTLSERAAVVNPLWSPSASMMVPRQLHTATLLPSGQVLVAGGHNSGSSAYLSSAELYQSATSTWAAAASMTAARQHHTATLLSDGQVLVAGGYDGAFLSSAER